MLGSCVKDKVDIDLPPPITEPTEPSNEPSEKLQVVWQASIGVVDTQQLRHEGMVLTKDNVVATPEKKGVGDVVRFWDKRTGDFQFEWENWQNSNYFWQLPQIVDENLFVNGGIGSALIDANNGQSIWMERHLWAGSYTNFTLGKIFHPVIDEDHLEILDLTHLTSVDYQTGSRDTVLTIPTTGFGGVTCPEIQPPTGWITPVGDTLMIFKLEIRTWPPYRIDIQAYNITADSVEWKLENFEPDGDSNKRPPLVEDGLVYLVGESTLYCLNVLNGDIVWQQEFSGMYHLGETNNQFFAMLLLEGKLVFSPNNASTFCFDAQTGRLLWKEHDSVSNPQNLVHHKGIIYATERGSGRLFAFDLETGEHFWREHSPNLNKYLDIGFQNDIAIDPETGYIYADDSYFVLCIKPYGRE